MKWKMMRKIVSAILAVAVITAGLPITASAAMFVPTEGQFQNEPIQYIPTWYLRHLVADLTGDSLAWADLTTDQQNQVKAEISRRQNGTSTIAGGASLAADIVAPAAATATGTGGAVLVTSGAGGSTSGASGAVTVASGTTTAGSGSATGNVIVQSGAGAASAVATAGGASGTITVRSQAGGANTGGASGQAGGAGGNVAITGGAGGATDSAGAHAGGAGADVTITAGAGGNASAGTGNGGAGGTITITTGSGGTSAGGTAGVAGVIILRDQMARKLTRATVANAGTVTVAQIRGGVLHQDASGGNVTMTSPTGTQISTEFPDLATGDSIVVHHTSNHGTNTSTIAAGTDVTLVGSGAIINTGGTFIYVKTGANTYDLLRVG